MLEWMNDYQALLWSLGGGSVLIFIASLFIMPALIARIRPDYFAHARRPPSRWGSHHPVVRWILVVLKNLLAVALIAAGLAMLVLPGQGLLTVLAGVMLLDFPAKYRFEQWLVSRPIVYRPVNWVRRRAGRLPLQLL